MDKLIVVSRLCERPSDGLALRGLFLMVDRLPLTVLVEVAQFDKDAFYYHHQEDGLFDFVKYLVTPVEQEEAIRLDVAHDYPWTVVVDSVRFENVQSIIGQIVNLHRILGG